MCAFIYKSVRVCVCGYMLCISLVVFMFTCYKIDKKLLLNYTTLRNHSQYLYEFSLQLFQPPSYNTHYQRESGVAALLSFLSASPMLSQGTRVLWLTGHALCFYRSIEVLCCKQTDGPLHACPWPDNLLLNKTRMSKLLITHNAACLVCLLFILF